MPIVAEQTFRIHHVATGWQGATYEINMSPGNVFAKIALNLIYEHTRTRDDVPPYDSQHTDFKIARIKRKRSDGVIEWIDIWSNGAYDPNMLGILISTYAADTEWYGILILEYWG